MESFVLLLKTTRNGRTIEHPNHPRRRHSKIGVKGPIALKKKLKRIAARRPIQVQAYGEFQAVIRQIRALIMPPYAT